MSGAGFAEMSGAGGGSGAPSGVCAPFGVEMLRRLSCVVVVNGRICLRRLWATTSVAISRIKDTFACLANRGTAAINKWQNVSTLCPILRMTAAAEEGFGQNHACVNNHFFPSSPLEGDDGSLLVLVFCLRGSQHLPSLRGGRRTTRILVSEDGVVEWRPGSETPPPPPVWHTEWGATQMFCGRRLKLPLMLNIL